MSLNLNDFGKDVKQERGTQRKLASVQSISVLEPIPKADNLELAHILGWKAIVQKGYKVGDKVVYIEIDSFIPTTNKVFDFLKDRCYKKLEDGREGYRIKTLRLRGQISQGLVMPMSILKGDYHVGTDVTEELGIVKYEPIIPKCLTGKVKGSLPSFVIKTDETRIQVLGDILSRYVNTRCYVTEKLDGSSVTYYLKDNIFGVCSRNMELKIDDEDNKKTNAMIRWGIEHNIEKKLREKSPIRNVIIQGEIHGVGICSNRLKLNEINVRFFNVFDIDKYRYLDYQEFIDFCKILDIETVPVVGTDFFLTDDIDILVELSKGKSVLNPEVNREGLVIRPMKEILDLGMSTYNFSTARLSFKVINPEYLLKHSE